MHLKGLITLTVLSALPLLTAGCKCIRPGGFDNANITNYCCGKFKGKMDDTGCEQRSIRKKLKSFLKCCIENSPNDPRYQFISNCNIGGGSANEEDESVEELERTTGLNATEIMELQRQNAGMMEEDDA